MKITYILTNKVPNLGRFLCSFDKIKIITRSGPIIIWGVLVGGILAMGYFDSNAHHLIKSILHHDIIISVLKICSHVSPQNDCIITI